MQCSTLVIFLTCTGPDGHKSSYPWPWLHRHSYEPKLEKQHIIPLYIILFIVANIRRKTHWGSEIVANPPVVDYNEIMNPETEHVGVGTWTKNIV